MAALMAVTCHLGMGVGLARHQLGALLQAHSNAAMTLPHRLLCSRVAQVSMVWVPRLLQVQGGVHAVSAGVTLVL